MLINQYTERGNRRFPHGLSAWNQRQQDIHVEAFLASGRVAGRRRLHELQNADVDGFINDIRREHGEQRAYRYALSLARFIRHFRIPVRVHCRPGKIAQKRLVQIGSCLDAIEDLTADQRARILIAIKEVL
jgi:hypothetical protein